MLTATIVGAVVVAACIGFAQPQALRLPWQQQPSRVLTKEEQRAQYLAALEEASSVSDYDRSAVRARTAPSLADGDRGALGAGPDDPQRRAAREAAAARRPPFTGSTVSERGPRGVLHSHFTLTWRFKSLMKRPTPARPVCACLRCTSVHALSALHGQQRAQVIKRPDCKRSASCAVGLQGDWAHPWQYDGNGQLFVLISDTWMRVHREPGTTRSVIVTDKSDGAKQHYRMRVPKGWPLEEVRDRLHALPSVGVGGDAAECTECGAVCRSILRTRRRWACCLAPMRTLKARWRKSRLGSRGAQAFAQPCPKRALLRLCSRSRPLLSSRRCVCAFTFRK